MYALIFFVGRLIYYAAWTVEFLMFIRALASWLPIEQDGPILSFVYNVTEAVIMPMRILLDRFEFTKRSPLDIPFFATVLFLMLLQIMAGGI